LPNHVKVVLRDGRQGRIVSWHHRAEAVTIEANAQRRIVPCGALTLRADGSVEETPKQAARRRTDGS
jgi:hypothetical protein